MTSGLISTIHQMLPQEAEWLANTLVETGFLDPPPPHIEGLAMECLAAGLGQVDLVRACAPSPLQLGRKVLSQLVGKPIVPAEPWHPTPPPPNRKEELVVNPRSRWSGSIITAVAPNPKRPGTATFLRYRHYRIGDTVDEFVARGGRWGDVGWDVPRGFIQLGTV